MRVPGWDIIPEDKKLISRISEWQDTASPIGWTLGDWNRSDVADP